MKACFIALTALLSAAGVPAQQLQYPEGAPIPRSLTPEEADYLARNPLTSGRSVTPPPTGPVHCVAEYEPMEGILIAWEGSNSWTTILANMGAEITTTGNAELYVAVDSSSEASSAESKLASHGAVMSRVHTMVVNTDTIWIRDYGPRYIYQGDVRCIVDHTYNRPRPNDNAFPTFFSGYKGHAFYEHQLVHGGGNYHLDALGNSFTTRLINNENSGLSEAQIHGIWQAYQNVDTHFFDPLPSSVDSTQHLDMWMQVASDDVVMISDWPAQQGSTQDQICDAAAVTMAAMGYTVHRIPARKVGSFFSTHYTYTNVVICNDLILIPSYRNSNVTQYNGQALAAWQAACPTKTVVQIDAEDIVSSAGVLHCIVMHVPEHLGGSNPTAYLIGPDGGEGYAHGEIVDIEWISDDDFGAVSADLLLSTDGGQSWPNTLATNLPASGSYAWTVPNLTTSQARVRVVVYDGQGNSGSDDSDADFSLFDPNGAALISYGSGKAGSLGVPVLSSQDLPILGSTVQLDLDQALPNGIAKLIRGPAKDSTPFDGAVILVAYDTIVDLNVDGSGHADMTGTVPNNPALAGVSFYWQAWIPNDPAAAGAGWACSQGLETRLGY